MGYDIYLEDEDGVVEVDSHMEGGIIAVGGNTQAYISITYNYSRYYHEHLDSKKGIRWLYGKKAKNTVKRLERAVKILGTEQNDNYWNATEGNAGHCLNVLLGWAKQHPEAVWDGD